MTAIQADQDIAAAVAQLEQDLAALPGDEIHQRPLDDLRKKREALVARIVTIRSARATLAGLEPEIAACATWADQLRTWRKTLQDEIVALPSPIRTDRDRGRLRNLQLSVVTIDSGLPADTGWEVETLRLGQLMRESGYVEGPRVANQVHGPLPWHGTLPAVENRLKALVQQRDDARARLNEALLDDAERDRRAAETTKRNALPQRKTRGDGSRYDKYADGRVVEVKA
jgi:hypothetical protein